MNGIPHAFIDEMLSWQPLHRAERRAVREGGALGTSVNLPSWSWSGWQCAIDPSSLRSGLEYSLKFWWGGLSRSMRATPLVKWYLKLYKHDDGNLVTEAGLLHRSRTLSPIMQPGWQQHPSVRPNEPAYFNHIHDPRERFRYPIMCQQSKPENFAVTNEAFLSGMTSRCASLRIRQAPSYPHIRQEKIIPSSSRTRSSVFSPLKFDIETSSTCPLITIETSETSWAGVLRITADGPEDLDGSLELMAVSKGDVAFKDLFKGFHDIGNDWQPTEQSECESSDEARASQAELPWKLRAIVEGPRGEGYRDERETWIWTSEADEKLAGLSKDL